MSFRKTKKSLYGWIFNLQWPLADRWWAFVWIATSSLNFFDLEWHSPQGSSCPVSPGECVDPNTLWHALTLQPTLAHWTGTWLYVAHSWCPHPRRDISSGISLEFCPHQLILTETLGFASDRKETTHTERCIVSDFIWTLLQRMLILNVSNSPCHWASV